MKIQFGMTSNETNAISCAIYEMGKSTSRSKTRSFCDAIDKGATKMHSSEMTTIEQAGVTAYVGQDLLTFDINEGAVLFTLQWLVKAASIITPVLVTLYGLIGMIKNAGKAFKDSYKAYTKEYDDKFGRTPTYSIGVIQNPALDLCDVVVVKADGFGNTFLVRAEHLKEVYDANVIMKLFKEQRFNDCMRLERINQLNEKGASFEEKNAAGCYVPVMTSEWMDITEDAALEMATERAVAVRKDLHMTAADQAAQEQH